MRSCWIGSPRLALNPVTSVLVRDRRAGQGKEADYRVLQHESRNTYSHEKLEEARKGSPPEPSEGNTELPTL